MDTGMEILQEKCKGRLTCEGLWNSLITLKPRMISGLFWTEYQASIGIMGLILAVLGGTLLQWTLVVSVVLLAMSPVVLPGFRLPARWMYLVGLILSFMASQGFNRIQSTNLAVVVTLLQCFDLCTRNSSLWPMYPFCQRWQRPSLAFNHPVVPFLDAFIGANRVSGLPYPLTTGQLHNFRTLGYNGASRLKAMARFRPEEGHHDGLEICQEELNWYGVKYVYTYRPLKPPWKPTQISHLYENTECFQHVPTWVPTWSELEEHFG